MGLGTFSLVGCGSTTAFSTLQKPNTVASATGDWDDVTAAVFYAATKTEMAMTGNGPEFVETGDTGTVRALYLLHTIKDTLVHFEVRKQTAAASGPVGVTCRIGRFSDPELEQRFIRSFRRRLKQLKGRDVAPLN